MSWVSCITDIGLSKLSFIQPITLTRATIGSGIIAQVDMRNATELSEEKMAGNIVRDVNKINAGVATRSIKARFGPASAAVGSFVAHEVGIWAYSSVWGEFLFLIAVDDAEGITIPTESESSEFGFDIDLNFILSGAYLVDVTVDGSAYVSNNDFPTYFANAMEGYTNTTFSFVECGTIPTEQIKNVNVVTPTAEDGQLLLVRYTYGNSADDMQIRVLYTNRNSTVYIPKGKKIDKFESGTYVLYQYLKRTGTVPPANGWYVIDWFRPVLDEVLSLNTPIGIPQRGTSVSYNMKGLTANHEVVRWNFSTSPENCPPANLSITTGTDYFTVYNSGPNSSETIKPTFVIPFNSAATLQS